MGFLALIINAVAGSEESQGNIETREFVVSDIDLLIAYTIAVVVVLGIFLYLARHLFIRKKTDYEIGDFESQKDKDYEKYHSDWTSEDFDFGPSKWDSIDEEEFTKGLSDRNLPDYYKILGVSHDSSQEAIKQQYRKLVKQWHPDKRRDPSSKDKMSEINKAYEVLSDEERRKRYDKYLSVS